MVELGWVPLTEYPSCTLYLGERVLCYSSYCSLEGPLPCRAGWGVDIHFNVAAINEVLEVL